MLCAAYSVFLSCLLCCLLSDSFDVLDGSAAVTEPEAPGFALDTCPWRSWKNNCCGFLLVSINARQLPRYKAAYKHLWGAPEQAGGSSVPEMDREQG